jgi:hypothetical protein
MQYVLGNMLNGGGINPDGLSLDLQFAADKTLTARRGPTPTFIRSSGDNGGTTYFGPLVDFELVDFGEVTAFSTTGISNGRASWFKSYEGIDITISYTGTRWRVVIDGVEDVYLAAPGSEWRPDQADWSSQEFTITTSSTFGIVKAANNEPRFDHNPTSPFACRGLLIEEGRTNALQHSANFKNTTSSSYWENSSATTVTVDQTTSPDGAATADLLTTSTTSFDCFVRRAINWVGSTQYSYSIFLKRGPSNHRYVGLYIGAGITGALQYPYFDFDNPTTVQIPSGTMVGTINSTRVDAYPNGWYRVSVTFTTAATPITIYGGVYVSTSNGTLSSTPTAGLDCYIWGIQAETGSFPTSYIPTTTGTLARGADVCNITGGDFNNFYNQSEGTLFADVSGLMNTTLLGNRSFFAISDGTYNNSLSILKASNIAGIRGEGVTGGGANQFTLSNAYAPFTQYKVALGVKTNDTNMAANGSLKTTDTSVTLPSTMNRLDLRDPTAAAGGHPSGHIAAIRYFKKRLPDAKLVTLTT